MEFGYCRISTNTQNIERQIRNILAKYPNAKIFQEVYTGTKQQGRKELEKILGMVRSGDTIIFDSVSRMSRNSDDGIRLYMELYEKGINLVFLKEPHINTETYTAALSQQINVEIDETISPIIEGINGFLKNLAKRQIELAFEQAQKEVDDLHQRTREGIETARRNGKQIGQQKGRKLNVKKANAAKEIIRRHSRTFGGSLSNDECMKLAGVSRCSFYKYKREIEAEFGE